MEWKCSEVRRIMRNKSIKNMPKAMVLSLYRDYGIVPKDSRDDNHNVTSEDTSTYKYVEIGDFVINKMKAWQGSMAVSNYEGIISPAYYVCSFIEKNIERKYVHYLLRNEAYKPEYLRLSTGLRVGQWDLGIDDFMKIPIVLPPLPEQQRIASYLDKKCGEIDELIALQEKMIAQLTEYKQAVITEAVTKGLDPNAKLVPSGSEWIGKVPEGWEISRFKTLFSTGKGLNFTKAELVQEGVPVISYGQVHSKINSGTCISNQLIRFIPESLTEGGEASRVHIGDFIFADTSEDKEGCGNAVYIDKEIGIYAGYHTVVAFTKDRKYSPYLAYLFLTDQWRSQIRSKVTGIKVFSISQTILNQTSIILPTLSEQKAIADYLDTKCSEIDSLIALKRQKIESLNAYKKSVIYETVTGKISI